MQTDHTRQHYTTCIFIFRHFENFHPDFSLEKTDITFLVLFSHIFGTTFIYYSPILSEHDENSRFHNVSKFHGHRIHPTQVIRHTII